MIQVPGPDTLTSCGDSTRRLQVGTEYVAGIGGACSSIRSWTELSGYNAQEIEQLRKEMDCGAASLLPSIGLSLAAFYTIAIL